MSEILTTASFSSNFPQTIPHEIDRENIAHTISIMLDGDTNVLIVHGADGLGKTTLLAQFVHARNNTAISVFLNTSSRFGYEPVAVQRDLCNQIWWVLNATQPEDSLSAEELPTLIYELQRAATRRNQSFYFVIDGLDEIPPEDSHLRGSILEMLPLGLPQFRFIFSARSRVIEEVANKLKGIPQTLPLTPFGLNDATEYFKELATKDQVEQLYKVSKGIPSRLSAFMRKLRSGTSISDLIDQLPELLDPEFDVEWQELDTTDEEQVLAVAILAHDRNFYDLRALSRLLSTQEADLCKKLQPLTFLSIPVQSTEQIQFISEPFRRFAEKRLSSLRSQVLQLAIEALQSEPLSDSALNLLPRYFIESNQPEKLISCLTPDHFASILERSGSTTPVREQAALGVQTASARKLDGELLRFAIQESSITNLDSLRISRAEIEARAAIGDFGSAVSLATSAVLESDRLQLLAAVCAARKRQGLDPETEVLDQIDDLIQRTSAADLGDYAGSLATDLMLFAPAYAISVVERMAKSPNGSSADLAFAKLSIIGAASKSSTEELSERAKGNIKDPKIAQFSSAMAMIAGEYSAAEIVREAEKLANVADRIFLLRSWAANTLDYGAAPSVVRYALELAIRTVEYVPNARHYRDFATPLPRAAPSPDVDVAVGIFDSQQSLLEDRGPTEEYVALQLLLSEIESAKASSSVSARLLETHFYIQGIGDLVTKATSLARFLASLLICDPKGKLESEGYFVYAEALDDFHSCISTLLSETADQIFVVERVLAALATNHVAIAIEIAERLNTVDRRDEALARIVDRLLHVSSRELDCLSIYSCIEKVVDRDVKDMLLVDVLERISEVENEECLLKAVKQALPVMQKCKEIRLLSSRARALALAGASVLRSRDANLMIFGQELTRRSEEALDLIDDEWLKIELAFQFASVFAVADREFSIRMVNKATNLRTSLKIHEDSGTYVTSLRLVNRAFAALAGAKASGVNDLGRVADRIRGLPSKRDQIRLWSDLACRLFARKSKEEAAGIVNREIKPLLASIKITDEGEWMRMVHVAAPAIYSANSLLGLEMIQELPLDWQSSTISNVVGYLLRNTVSGDPFEGNTDRYSLEHGIGEEVCKLLSHVQEDVTIFRHVGTVVESLLWTRNKQQLTAEQRVEIGRMLKRIVEKQLPAADYIAHEGFKIACEALLERLEKRPTKWESLIQRAEALPNKADALMVLCVIAQYAENLGQVKRTELFESVRAQIRQLPSLLDRADRFAILADACEKINQGLCKKVLGDAMALAVTSTDPEMQHIQKRIIDTAYGISEDLAVALVASMDNDDARSRSKLEAKEQLQHNKLRDQMLDPKKHANSVLCDGVGDKLLARAAWSSLGSLNANRAVPQNLENLREYIRAAAKMSFSISFPIFSWAVETFGRKAEIAKKGISSNPEANAVVNMVRSTFDATLLGSDLIAKVVLRRSGIFNAVNLVRTAGFHQRTSVIRAGERDDALAVIGDWIQQFGRNFLKITDPYSGPEEVALVLQMVQVSHPELEVAFLTSKAHQRMGDGESLGAIYAREWKRASDQEPPSTQVVVAGVRGTNASPVHDRWILTDGAGLRIGTSLNSLGITSDSEISQLTSVEVKDHLELVDAYLHQTVREFKGVRIIFDSFTLE